MANVHYLTKWIHGDSMWLYNEIRVPQQMVSCVRNWTLRFRQVFNLDLIYGLHNAILLVDSISTIKYAVCLTAWANIFVLTGNANIRNHKSATSTFVKQIFLNHDIHTDAFIIWLYDTINAIMPCHNDISLIIIIYKKMSINILWYCRRLSIG